jgi:deoxyhypusine monooxygenase
MSIYHNTSLSLFNRYRALFSLRDLCTEESVLGICEGLNNPNFSDLFQHEIGFVLGQLQEKAAISLPFLVSVKTTQALRNSNNHYIVRHEVAEAIGSITDDQNYLKVL